MSHTCFHHTSNEAIGMSCLTEHLANNTRAFSDVLVHNGAGHHLQEICVNIARDGTSQQGLSGAWGAVEKHTLGRLDSHTYEEVGVHQWQLNHLN